MGDVNFVRDHMIVDAALQAAIIARCVAGRFGDQPDRAVHDLGAILLPDGRNVRVHLRHAADAVLLDDCGQVVLITRTENPGAGRLALPGGFIDEVKGAVETVLAAARREAVEETGIDPGLLRDAAPVGPRRFDRPFDIRMAWNNLPGTDIRFGEIFAVSTQGYRFRISGDLRRVRLQAGDDAKAVRVAEIATLNTEGFAVPDHVAMIAEAVRGLK